MNAFYGIGIVAALLYGFLVDATYFKIYFIILIFYILFTQIGTLSPYNNKRKKLNIATWNAPNSPEIFVSIEWDTTNAELYLEKFKRETGKSISFTQFVGFCASRALSNQPDLNGRLCFGNYYPKDQCDISFLVSMEGGKDLGVTKIANADKKSLEDFHAELTTSSKRLRDHKDKDHQSRTSVLSFMPTFILELITFIGGYVSCAIGVGLPFVGLKKHQFGTCVITSVGMLGYDHAFVPIPPFTNMPLLITLGAVKRKPVAVEDRILIRNVAMVTLTLDHRYTDGARASAIYQKFVKYINDPEKCVKEDERAKSIEEGNRDERSRLIISGVQGN